uniref:Protein kinase C iota type n=1 Tax=Culex pipiens TaxID=7175 RepID=A0A8D8A4V7_CULPI
MPIQIANESNNSGGGGAGNEIKVKIAYSGEVMITYIDEAITYDGLCREIREICRFGQEQDFTMKWVDEENDPCTIQSDLELDEAIRLYEVNRDSELVIHGESLFYLACRLCQNSK